MTDAPLEMWGGIEATVNRTGRGVSDQIRLSGHDRRIEDCDRIGALGLTVLRFPVLWERTERAPGVLDWAWPDARLERLRSLGIAPVLGLVHHGSGPTWVDLLSPGFAPGLTAFAAAAARRYPWVEAWTPVNEPLTTARFSALYGLWYPHLCDERAFWAALLNQIDATRGAMRAIRAVNPRARLVQTEDFGRTDGTAPCMAQVRYENDRRLMTWDLLCGRVVAGHPLYRHLCDLGFGTRLAAISDDPCPPDVIGMNHYITSDRFLDHRLELYPADVHGGNATMRYADVETVRALDIALPDWAGHLSCLWDRYGIPLAVTECHIACTVDEQCRWLAECWHACLALRATGVPVTAVTAWALLGAHGWDTLLTSPTPRYESGAFDVSDGHPRATPLADLIRELAAGRPARGEGLHQPGWWRRTSRLLPDTPVARALPAAQARHALARGSRVIPLRLERMPPA